MSIMLSTCWEMRNDYTDSHPEIAIRRSLEGAHSSVTPDQGAERPQPGDSSEQGKSAPKGLTSIFDAKIPLFVSCADTRTSVPTFRNAAQGCGHSNECPYKWMFIAVQACGRPQQRAPKNNTLT